MVHPIDRLHNIIFGHRKDGRAAMTLPILISEEIARSATAFRQGSKPSLAPNDGVKCTGETQPVSIRHVDEGRVPSSGIKGCLPRDVIRLFWPDTSTNSDDR